MRLRRVAAWLWVATSLALASGLLGCTRAGEPVPLLTGVGEACYAGGETGMVGTLVVDAEHGTSFNGRPVMWPDGFTGLRVGDEVEVLNAGGNLVATTGRDYYISIAPVYGEANQRKMNSVNAYPAAANCTYAWDFVDCGPATKPSEGGYCRRE